MLAAECEAGVYFPHILCQSRSSCHTISDNFRSRAEEKKGSGAIYANQHAAAHRCCNFPSFKSQIKPNE